MDKDKISVFPELTLEDKFLEFCVDCVVRWIKTQWVRRQNPGISCYKKDHIRINMAMASLMIYFHHLLLISHEQGPLGKSLSSCWQG